MTETQQEYRTTFFFKKSSEDAKLPTQEQGDVGFDIYASEDMVLVPGKTTMVNTNLQFARDPTLFDHAFQPMSMLLKIEGRSGLASKGIFPVGGIVDPSYRGDIKVCLYSCVPYRVSKGDKIAQLVAYPVVAKSDAHIVEVHGVDWQQDSKRGDKGFGSSGK